jgi:predicted ester cyclase
VIADCVVHANRIVEEWLVRDELSILRQFGYDEQATVATIAQSFPQSYGDALAVEVARAQGQPRSGMMPAPQRAGFDPEDFVRRTLEEVWNQRAFGRIYERYAPTYHCHAASGRELYGQDDYLRFIWSWLAVFPTARLEIDHVCVVGGEADGYRTAVRWRLLGVHEGYGMYGKPTGRPVQIMGMTQHRLKDGKLQEEWTVFDELTVMAQVYEAR